MHVDVPWFFYLVMVLDPIVIITTGFVLMRRIRKVVANLETTANNAVANAATDVASHFEQKLRIVGRPMIAVARRFGIDVDDSASATGNGTD